MARPKFFFLLSILPLLMGAHSIDFDKITLWTGQGENRAALVVQYPSDIDPTAYVWGYRWPSGTTRTGEDMFRAVCGNSSELVMLTQVTGQYGSTLCGVGFGAAEELVEDIFFDFDMAKDYEWINFDYFNTNSWFGQSEAPGDRAPAMAAAAITAAKTTHVIQHPFDYTAYGYPAYDYDCWKLRDGSLAGLWMSGWYAGYWSYWLSGRSSSEWTYSGTGFTVRELTDGSIDAWVYTPFETPGVGGFGEGNPPTDNPSLISYRPASTSGIATVEITPSDSETFVYTLSGIKVATFQTGCPLPPLRSGIYLLRTGNETRKIYLK